MSLAPRALEAVGRAVKPPPVRLDAAKFLRRLELHLGINDVDEFVRARALERWVLKHRTAAVDQPEEYPHVLERFPQPRKAGTIIRRITRKKQDDGTTATHVIAPNTTRTHQDPVTKEWVHARGPVPEVRGWRSRHEVVPGYVEYVIDDDGEQINMTYHDNIDEDDE